MDALDKLGLAIVNAGYTWTNEMREAYEQGRKEISQLTAMTKEPTKLMVIPALMEAAGWVQKKEWVGLSMNEAKDFYDSKLDRAELINKIDEFLEEKNK
jgi:hypothetical protein